MQSGLTLWLTGMSGAGKSTLARHVERELRTRQLRVEVLDGDIIRENLSKGLGFSKEDRDTNIRRIGFVSNLLSRNDVIVIVAAISPYRSVRDEVRVLHGKVPFVEIFVHCPVDVLTKRDVKGLYEKALRGEISNFTGISDPYEEPTSPEIVVRTDKESENESASKILLWLERNGCIAEIGKGTHPR
jgi:adenylyl-sulfate kinase